ncbi:uncharacterized protein C8orf76 homolog isoform X2 [Dermacentor andersoni]|uniref:uncharacterized protein C8orf76 homolog isoform X2 n=1 Tax=Dermacentor andersoni TaxID=34620 RepID=UPI002416D5A6|nr:uncharacterized protein C8orf76 homolog isoform X2 [Dermacentor andersoni]
MCICHVRVSVYGVYCVYASDKLHDRFGSVRASSFAPFAMEFAFDDDVFDSPRIRGGEPGTSYNAKICESEWFLTATTDDHEEKMMLEKYKGDYHYARNDFRNAFEVYERCLDLAPKSATSVKRDCLEGMSRCCLKLGRNDEALQYADTLETLATNSDHRVAVWMLQSEIYNHTKNATEESAALCRCLLVRPWTSDLWYKLSVCCLSQLETRTDVGNLPLKAGACLLKARMLYQGALSGNQSFAKVEQLVSSLELPEDFTTQALNEFEKDSDTVNGAESDEEAESLLLLGMKAADVMSAFEERWLSSILQYKPDSKSPNEQ